MIQLAVDKRGLTLTSSEQAFGFMLKRDLHIKGAQWLEIEWGVGVYPPGIAVEVDTGEMGPGTSSSAFIKSISLHSAQ